VTDSPSALSLGSATLSPPSPDDAGALAAQLRVSATRLARQLRQQSDTGLSPSQISALTTIECHGPLTLGALAERERVAPPTITKVVAKLQADGLVRRAVDGHDRRISHLTTTDEGDALLAESRRRRDLWLAAGIEDLDADQRARLAAALDVLDALTTRNR
jgi:DNA-binding MarR family transcriptional regulator